MEKRFAEAQAEKQAEYEAKKTKREAQRKSGRKPRGSEPKPPKETTKDSGQYNFTDTEGQIMKAGYRSHFAQSYNVQAVVETASF